MQKVLLRLQLLKKKKRKNRSSQLGALLDPCLADQLFLVSNSSYASLPIRYSNASLFYLCVYVALFAALLGKTGEKKVDGAGEEYDETKNFDPVTKKVFTRDQILHLLELYQHLCREH